MSAWLFNIWLNAAVAEVVSEPMVLPTWTPAFDSKYFLGVQDATLGSLETLTPRIVTMHLTDWSDRTQNSTIINPLVTKRFGALRFGVSTPLMVAAKNTAFTHGTLTRVHCTEIISDIKWRITSGQNSPNLAFEFQQRWPVDNLGSFTRDTRHFEGTSILSQSFQNFNTALNLSAIYNDQNQYHGRFQFGAQINLSKHLGAAVEYSTLFFASKIEQTSTISTVVQNESHIVQLGLQHVQGVYAEPHMQALLSIRPKISDNIDTDGDGITDDTDQCIHQPEDADQFEDWDGCPEVNQTLLTAPIHTAHEAERGIQNQTIQASLYTGLRTQSSTFDMDISEEFEEQMLSAQQNLEESIPVLGSLKLIAVDNANNRISNATWTIDDTTGVPFRSTELIVPLLVGKHDVIVKAEGYRPLKTTLEIHNEEIHIVHLEMIKHQVASDLQLPEKIYFHEGSHTIDQRSHTLLDEIVDVMSHHSLIKLVQIEGHTDKIGNPALNKRLSQQRADEVRMYLINKGIEPERLVAVGYGSEQPIESNETTEGRAANRRVVFTILDKHN